MVFAALAIPALLPDEPLGQLLVLCLQLAFACRASPAPRTSMLASQCMVPLWDTTRLPKRIRRWPQAIIFFFFVLYSQAPTSFGLPLLTTGLAGREGRPQGPRVPQVLLPRN